MKEAYFWCYPWDLEDEGLDESLARLRGEIGVDAISVAAVNGPVHEFRPRMSVEARVFRAQAAANFQPTSKLYSGIQIRPVAAPWMKSRSAMARICEAASKSSLRVRGWVACCHHDSLAQRHPNAACVNAMGEVSHARLCPSHPEVREYLGSLVEDISAQFPIETIELDDASFGHGWPWYAQASFTPTESIRTLMQWCFCPACRQRAIDMGVDASSAMKRIRDRVDLALTTAGDDDESIEDTIGGDAGLRGYQSLREESVTSLVKALRSRVKNRLVVHVCGPRLLTGVNVSAMMEHCDGAICQFAGGRPIPSTEPGCKEIGVERWESAQLCYPPHAPNSAALVAAVHDCVRGGCQRVGFSNYGIVSDDCLEWVRQAIRYARREG
jgi:hypothetical protein